MSDDAYKQFGTPRQIEIHEAIKTHGGVSAAAKALGVGRTTVQHAEKALRKKLALQGVIPTARHGSPVPAPYNLRGESELTDLRTGEPVMVWRKTGLDSQHRLEMVIEAIGEACKPLTRIRPQEAPKFIDEDLGTVYPIADLHLAMRSSKSETGNDWNLEIAERTVVSCFKYLIDNSPKSEVGILANVGDMIHFDSLLPVTPKSRHILDASASYGDAVKAAIRITRHIVSMMLRKHKKVIIVWAQGNHDEVTSICLMNLFASLYENEPRVEVVESDRPYYAVKFGKCMLAFHHSHLAPMEKLDRIFASMFKEMWGKTTLHVCFTGDKHHSKTIDAFGMTVFQQPTLACMDAYAAKLGYYASREANAYTFHKSGHRVSTITVTPEMVE